MQDLTYTDVKRQSLAVFGQFGQSKWIPFAKENAAHHKRRDAGDLRWCGVGKTLLSVAMGASLEKHVETIKKYRDRVDIVTCDKGFQKLMERGIRPDYVMLCDCNVVWQKWGPSEVDTSGVKLIATPYANVDWTRKWRGPIYFYVNRDAINSEEVFLEIMGHGTRTVPASSNVSNAQLIFFTGMDEWNRTPFAGYEQHVLVGYDYSWRPQGNYYAWTDPRPKRLYMNHRTLRDINGELVYSSENLIFSARWLSHYLRAFPQLKAVNCSDGLLEIPPANLESTLAGIDVGKGRAIRAAQEVVASAQTALAKAREHLTQLREGYFNG